jgi:hypothetical protein
MVGIRFIVSGTQQQAALSHLPHPTPPDDHTSLETSQNATSHTHSGHSTNYHFCHNPSGAIKRSVTQRGRPFWYILYEPTRGSQKVPGNVV